jgi:hypothetical protein
MKKRDVRVWLVTTEHLEGSLWFRDDEDFKVGMNYVAVQVAVSDLVVLAFILMSNHVHFILVGTREEVLAFINNFKMRYAAHVQRKYGLHEVLRRNRVHLLELNREEESEERAIAYVQMNSVAANICANSTQYPWGSGSAFFNPVAPKGLPVGRLSIRARRRALRSEAEVPGEWLLGDDGYILPFSYLNIKYVEQLYGTPRRMNYFLNTSSKAQRRIASGESDMPSFRDQIVASAVPDLCRTLFGKPCFQELNPAQKAELLRQLRYRFSSSVNQLSRVTGLTYDAAARLLDNFFGS